MPEVPRKRFYKRWWFRIPVGLLLLVIVTDFIVRKMDRTALPRAVAEADRLYPGDWRIDDLIEKMPETAAEHHEAMQFLREWSLRPAIGEESNSRIRQPIGFGRPNELLEEDARTNLTNTVNDAPKIFPNLNRFTKLREVSCRPIGLDPLQELISTADAVHFLARGHLFLGILALEDQKIDEAIHRFSAMLNLESWLYRSPHWLCQSRRWGIHRDAITLLERILGCGEVTSEQLKGLIPLLKRELEFDSLRVALRTFADDQDRDILHRYAKVSFGDPDFLSVRYYGYRNRANSIRILTELRQSVDQDGLTPKESHTRYDDVALKRLRLKNEEESELAWFDVQGIAFASAPVQQHLLLHQRTRLALLGIAVEQFRLEQKRFPTDLQELIPNYLAAIPVDPLTESSVILKTLPDRCVVYFVGPNHNGEQGLDAEKPDRDEINRRTDSLFEIFLPEHRRQPPKPNES